MKRMIVGVFVGLMAAALVGCSSTGVGDTQDNRAVTTVANETTYNVAEGGKVVIFNNDGDVTGCYDLDLNGSTCNVETSFDGLYEPEVTDA